MTSQPHSVLIVDDTIENLRVLGEMLEDDGHEVRIASKGENALELVRLAPVDLILLDVMMPGMDGHEVCRRLKSDPATAEIPVIFLTALNDEADEAAGLDLGAVDYITKPFKMDLVRKRIHNHLVLRQLQNQLKEQSTLLERLVQARTAQLTEVNQRLSQLDRTKGMFLRLLSQEVRGPANGLVGIGHLALAGIEDTAKRNRLQGLFDTSRRRLDDILGMYEKLVPLQEHDSAMAQHPVKLDETLATCWERSTESALAKSLKFPSASSQSFIVAGDTDLLLQALSPLVQLLVEAANADSSVECEFRESANTVELALTIASDWRLGKKPVPLESLGETSEAGAAIEALGLNLSLCAVVLGTLGGSAAVSSPGASKLVFQVVLKRYQPR